MEQEEITKIYETLAPMAGDYLNAQAEQIGQAQSSMGALANAVKGQSQTAGLGNYTYNRLMRPQVDTMRDEIMVKGYTNQLNRLLSDALSSARKNYIRKTGGTGTSSTSGTGASGAWSGDFEEQEKETSKPKGSEYNPEDYIKGGYDFYNYGYLPGVDGKKYPLTVDTPSGSTSYQDYTRKFDTMSRGTEWVKYLKSVGYTG